MREAYGATNPPTQSITKPVRHGKLCSQLEHLHRTNKPFGFLLRRDFGVPPLQRAAKVSFAAECSLIPFWLIDGWDEMVLTALFAGSARLLTRESIRPLLIVLDGDHSNPASSVPEGDDDSEISPTSIYTRCNVTFLFIHTRRYIHLIIYLRPHNHTFLTLPYNTFFPVRFNGQKNPPLLPRSLKHR